jgi:tRNA modification GTPase
MDSDDTIVAIATPPGTGGIAVIRLSGKESREVASRIFSGKESPRSVESHRILYGKVIDPVHGEKIDEVLLAVMHGPRTFTGEDTVEISCHGGVVPAQRIVEICINEGARIAERGEFTKRAFLNGRIDLIQAEAVLDIVSAKTREGLRGALFQLEGVFSSRIQGLKEGLSEILRDIELLLDFSDEEEILPEKQRVIKRLDSTREMIQDLIRKGKSAGLLRDGVSAVIIGKPNVGKSSLLNALLLEERAIVTPVPGTTRDVIEGWINVGGIPLKLYDTCGFQNSKDIVEEMGMKKTQELLDNSSFILFVMDRSLPVEREDREIFEKIKHRPLILVVNKTDLENKIDVSEIIEDVEYPMCEVSARDHTGIEVLNKEILTLIGATDLPVEDGIPTRLRHMDLLSRAEKSLSQASFSFKQGRSPEVIAVDVRESLDCLGEIIGEITPDDILDRIFREFCIGK